MKLEKMSNVTPAMKQMTATIVLICMNTSLEESAWAG
jgi:hypothetical protein